MNSSARAVVLSALLVVFGAISASAQVVAQPAPRPIVTADSEPWYLNGEPITFSGNFYYPSGAQIPFSSNEMVRSGFFNGVPLYSRTTDEPYSVVYVPLSRGFMQPYMRPRAGDVAGTSGTMAPAGVAAAASPLGVTVPPAQAAGPPTLVAGPPADDLGRPTGVIPAIAADEPRPVGTSGTSAPAPVGTTGTTAPVRVSPMRTRIGPRPEGLNAIFIEYKGRRWFSEGRPIPRDAARLLQIGELRGFPVYVDREAPEARLYVATAADGSMVAPYTQRR